MDPIKLQVFETFECSDHNSSNVSFGKTSLFLFSKVIRLFKTHPCFILDKIIPSKSQF